jgi:hypothetical protein
MSRMPVDGSPVTAVSIVAREAIASQESLIMPAKHILCPESSIGAICRDDSCSRSVGVVVSGRPLVIAVFQYVRSQANPNSGIRAL